MEKLWQGKQQAEIEREMRLNEAKSEYEARQSRRLESAYN